jgi:hypothetical protein
VIELVKKSRAASVYRPDGEKLVSTNYRTLFTESVSYLEDGRNSDTSTIIVVTSVLGLQIATKLDLTQFVTQFVQFALQFARPDPSSQRALYEKHNLRRFGARNSGDTILFSRH